MKTNKALALLDKLLGEIEWDKTTDLQTARYYLQLYRSMLTEEEVEYNADGSRQTTRRKRSAKHPGN